MPAWPSTSLSRAVTHSSECRSRFSQCGPSEARGSAGAIGLRKEVEDYLRRLVTPRPPGKPSLPHVRRPIVHGRLETLAHVGYVIGGGAETSLEGVKLILNVGDRLTEGLSCTPEGGSGAFYALTVLVRLESTFLPL